MHILCTSPLPSTSLGSLLGGPWLLGPLGGSLGWPLGLLGGLGCPLGALRGSVRVAWAALGNPWEAMAGPLGIPGSPRGVLRRPWGNIGGASGALDPPQAPQECPWDSPGPPKTPLDAPEEALGEPRGSLGGRFFDFWKTLYFLRKIILFEAGGVRGAPRWSPSGAPRGPRPPPGTRGTPQGLWGVCR